MWQKWGWGLLCVGVSYAACADDVRETCADLAIGIGQYEKTRLICDMGGIDSSQWQLQIKQLNCSQVLGDDVLTQVINTASNDMGYIAQSKGKTQFCEQDGLNLMQQLSTPK